MILQPDTLCVSLNLPLPQSPVYRCGEYGNWKLLFKTAETFERGYFTGWDSEPPGYYIEKDGHIWMSTSRLERESHAVHLNDAHGNVVMCGVGMGMYLFNLAAKPEVKSILAVDLDPAVVDLVRDASGFDNWVGRDKIKFILKNALELSPDLIGENPIDYLYVDIWPELGNPETLAQTQAIQAAVNARKVGWWGQELDFIQWLFDHRPVGHQPMAPDLQDFTQATRLPMVAQSAGYLAGCEMAGKVFSTYGSMPFALASRD